MNRVSSVDIWIADCTFINAKSLTVACECDTQILRYIIYTTCVYPPALSSILVVARVAELGKQVKNEDTVLEMPWARSSWKSSTCSKQKVNRWLVRIEHVNKQLLWRSRTLPGWDVWNIHVYQHRSSPVRRTRRNRQTLWPLCLQRCQGKCARQASVAAGIWE